MTIREILEQYPLGLTIQQLRLKSGLDVRDVKLVLKKLAVVQDGDKYILYDSPQSKEKLMSQITDNSKSTNTPRAPTKVRHRPFTPNPTMGYQVAGAKVKIFLSRRASSHTLTLSLDDLKDLVRAVKKSA